MVGGYQYISMDVPKKASFTKRIDDDTHKKLLTAIETGKPVILDITFKSEDLVDQRLVVSLSSTLRKFPNLSNFTGHTLEYTFDITTQEVSSSIRVNTIE